MNAKTQRRQDAKKNWGGIAKLRSEWFDADDAKGVMNVIITGGADDPEHIAKHVRSKAQRKALAARLMDPANDFRLTIVVDNVADGL